MFCLTLSSAFFLRLCSMAAVKILLIHGLESGVMGNKAVYLRNQFGSSNVMVPAMETGTLSLSKNSFLMHGVYNLGSLLSGKYQEQVAHSTLMSGVDILSDALSTNTFDIVVGSSMGGAIIVEALARRGHLFKCPVLLLAPAQRTVRNWFAVADELSSSPASGPLSISTMYAEINRYRAECPEGRQKLVVVHGALDSVVNIDHSREFANNVVGTDLVEVSDGTIKPREGDVLEQAAAPQLNKFANLIRDIVKK